MKIAYFTWSWIMSISDYYIPTIWINIMNEFCVTKYNMLGMFYKEPLKNKHIKWYNSKEGINL